MQDLVLDTRHHVRVGPWRGQPNVAHLATFTDQPLHRDLLADCLAQLADRGFGAVITSALPPHQHGPYLERGFRIERSLLLLKHPLDPPPARPDRPIRRARRRDRTAIVDIDRRAFDDFWQLDSIGLVETLSATPLSRMRVAGRNEPLGYAVAGLAGRRGYLQRLAVGPEFHGQGLGRALVADALRWMSRRGADDALVNTQTDNEGARQLYERTGFVPEKQGLAVLRLDGLE